MKIKTNQVLKNLKGDVLKMADENLTVGTVLIEALLAIRQNYVLDKVKSYFLAKRIQEAKGHEIEVDGDDYGKLVKTIETTENFSPLIVGQTIDLIKEK